MAASTKPLKAGGYRLADSAMMTRVGQETVLLDSPSGNYYSLDESGTTMLEVALETSHSATLAERLVALFHADEQTLMHDFRELMTELQEEGLVEAK